MGLKMPESNFELLTEERVTEVMEMETWEILESIELGELEMFPTMFALIMTEDGVERREKDVSAICEEFVFKGNRELGFGVRSSDFFESLFMEGIPYYKIFTFYEHFWRIYTNTSIGEEDLSTRLESPWPNVFLTGWNEILERVRSKRDLQE
jgi:hypothetical protein